MLLSHAWCATRRGRFFGDSSVFAATSRCLPQHRISYCWTDLTLLSMRLKPLSWQHVFLSGRLVLQSYCIVIKPCKNERKNNTYSEKVKIIIKPLEFFSQSCPAKTRQVYVGLIYHEADSKTTEIDTKFSNLKKSEVPHCLFFLASEECVIFHLGPITRKYGRVWRTKFQLKLSWKNIITSISTFRSRNL